MGLVRQFYDGAGVPFTVPCARGEVAAAWRSHRTRLRAWLAALDDDGWAAPTRCTDWQVVDLARHLVSGSQFLGYTLHESGKGGGTTLLRGFDAQRTAVVTAAQFEGSSPGELVDLLTRMDARVDHELAVLESTDGDAPAESPPGRVSARMAVDHFLFDSWTHERDLMIPAGQVPASEPAEAALVAAYVVGLAGVAHWTDEGDQPPVSLTLHVSDLGVHLRVEIDRGGSTAVSVVPPSDSPDLEATAGDIVDRATGRVPEEPLVGDAALAYLDRLAEVMR